MLKKLISKVVLLLLFTPLLYAQQEEKICPLACNLFSSNVNSLISSNQLLFPGIVDDNECYEVPQGFNSGNLLSVKNSSWFLIKILSGSELTFDLNNTGNHDIDAAIWGPIAENNLDNSCRALTSLPKSSNNSLDSTTLFVNDAEQGAYYLLMVSNFSNSPTSISIPQPSGGSVEYLSYCSGGIFTNDESDNFTNIDSSSNNYNTGSHIKLNQILPDSSKLNILSRASVEMLPGFSTSPSSSFEAKIESCYKKVENYSDSLRTIVCENFFNHYIAAPHLYSNTTSNELVGSVLAKIQPEYMAYNDEWKKMSKIGIDKEDSSRFLWAFKEPYQGNTNISLRTEEGCPVYPDVRLTEFNEYLAREDEPIPAVPPIENYADFQTPFFAISNMKDSAQTQTFLHFFLKPEVQNLIYKINDGPWRANIQYDNFYEEFSQRNFAVTNMNNVQVPKDFILDLTQDNGQTIDRYIVTRNNAGAHFTSTTVFNRVADSTVIVSLHQGDFNVPMKLGEHLSYKNFETSYHLGKMEAGAYIMPLKSLKDEFTLDESIYIRVRFDELD